MFPIWLERQGDIAMKKAAFLVYGVTAYFVFFGTLLYMMGFMVNMFVPKTMDVGPQGPLAMALLINGFWIVLFGVQHTVMARPGFKEKFTKFVPEPIERSTYVLVSSLILIGLFAYWRPIGGVVWQLDGMAANLMLAIYVLGWLVVFASTFIIDHFDLFGLKQVYQNMVGKTPDEPSFQVSLLYRVVRHPLMVGWIMLFFATPIMTLGHLLFAVGFTAYILVALVYEERDMVALFGDKYKAYQQAVPKIIPFTKKIHGGTSGKTEDDSVGHEA